jgi:hypothetical protein
MNKLVGLYPQDQTDAARELFAFKTFHGKYLRFHTPPSSPKDGSGCSTEGAENGARYERNMGLVISAARLQMLVHSHAASGRITEGLLTNRLLTYLQAAGDQHVERADALGGAHAGTQGAQNHRGRQPTPKNIAMA